MTLYTAIACWLVLILGCVIFTTQAQPRPAKPCTCTDTVYVRDTVVRLLPVRTTTYTATVGKGGGVVRQHQTTRVVR